jgi:hypothetical protein
MLFTFITESGGATAVEQFEGRDLAEAVQRWSQRSSAGPRLDAWKRLDEGNRPVPVEGTRAVWCLSGIDDADVFFMVHIVATGGEGT